METPQIQNPDLSCTVQRLTAEIDAQTYIDRYRHADRFVEFCKQCGNYGRRHGCPPFDYDPLTRIQGFDKVRIIGAKVVPTAKDLPLRVAHDLLCPVTVRLNDELLGMERELDGLAFGFVGTCPYCGNLPCARIEGKPCRHPEWMRPSLEAYGFDIMATARDLLQIDIKWGSDGKLPEYLILVCGVFYGHSS